MTDPTGDVWRQPSPAEPAGATHDSTLREPSPWAPPGTAAGTPAPEPPGPTLSYPAYPTYSYPPSYPVAVPYWYPAYSSYPVTPPNNGLAIASLVVSLAGIGGLTCNGLGGAMGLTGAILGHVARHQIRRSGERGSGMALAGVIVGWIVVGLAAGLITLFALFIAFDGDPQGVTSS
jgi:hypothetical protein